MLTISFSICREEQKSPQHPDVGVWSCVQSEVVVHLAGVSLSDRVLSREDVFNSLSTCQSDMLYYCAALCTYCSGGTGVRAVFDSLKQERSFCAIVQRPFCLDFVSKFRKRLTYDMRDFDKKAWLKFHSQVQNLKNLKSCIQTSFSSFNMNKLSVKIMFMLIISRVHWECNADNI